MKNLNATLFFIGGILGTFVTPAMPQEGNRLNWVEISQTKFSTQIMFDFVNPVRCQPELVKETRNLNLAFPGMSLQNFDEKHVQSQLSLLKADGMLKSIAVSEKTKSNPHVNLALEFSSSRNITNPKTNTAETRKNRFLIKWSVLDNPHRLIVDIFVKEDLEKLMKKDAVLLYATNDIQHYDSSLPTSSSAIKEDVRTACAENLPRIVIDPGHGGANTGKKGHLELLEKDITLDISRRVHAMLKKKGHRSLLIRNSDKDISLLERAQLAHQLQGDLFVSIHANSAGKMDSDASGLETFYLNGQELLSDNNKTGFASISLDDNARVIQDLNTHMKTTLNQSKMLAEHIQKNVLSTLAQKNITLNNRGIKGEKFRVLLRTAGASIPASLVEVGFLTSRNEAKKLATSAYRTMIAQGICNGICSYLDAL